MGRGQKVQKNPERKKIEYLKGKAYQDACNLLPRALAYLGRLIEDTDAPHGARLQASAMIMDRAMGKAKEIKEIDVKIDINAQHLVALKELNAELMAAQGQSQKLIDITPDKEDLDAT